MSIHVWHHNIHQNKIVCASWLIFKQIHNFFSVCCACYDHTGIFQYYRSKFSIQIIILSHKNMNTRQISMQMLFLF